MESFEDLYGFDIAEREWLHIRAEHGGPSGGEGCALTAVDSVLHVLSPSMPSSATAGGSQMSSSMQNIHSSSSMGGLIAVDETQSAAQLIRSSSQQQIEQSLVLSRRASTESLASSNMDAVCPSGF